MSMLTDKITPKFRLWLQYDNELVFGKEGVEILEAIEKYGSVSEATKNTSYSYRFVWNYLERIKEKIGASAIEGHRGGSKGGGGAKLTEIGKTLIMEYKRYEELLKIAVDTGG
ncbi:MAG TPA: ModE family transcriptional regulator [archaeon]|nr:ModE family transcriptional regulator [archaeon]